MEVSPDRCREILGIVKHWKEKQTFVRQELEQLIGKLQFVASCVRPGRLFISRLLNELRGTVNRRRYDVTVQMLKDLSWWEQFLPTYNGISVTWMQQMLSPDSVLSVDASGSGIGGYLVGREYLRVHTPEEWRRVNIAYMEMWGVIVAIRTWGDRLGGLRVVVKCDNESVVTVLLSGRSRDLFLQAGMREVAYLLAVYKMELKVVHLTSAQNRVADWLSRWGNAECRRAFNRFSRDKSLRRREVKKPVFKFTHDW